jgi:hypothetical protein
VQKSVCDAEDAMGSYFIKVVGMDGFEVVEPRENDLEQILADRSQGPFGGKIGFVQIVEAAGSPVGVQNGTGDFAQIEIHRGTSLGFSGAGSN